MNRYLFLLAFIMLLAPLRADYILVPMDDSQTNHLKSYGIAFWALKSHQQVQWLLNYEGGSFLFSGIEGVEKKMNTEGVFYKKLSLAEGNELVQSLEQSEEMVDVVTLRRAPKIAVYAPKQSEVWDDAVFRALSYADIPFDQIYDEEILEGKLETYDWVHLHHEDFTGQHGKLYGSYRSVAWYKKYVSGAEEAAEKFGYQKVSQMKLGVAQKIQTFIEKGGHMFAMCSATDTYDIALAAHGTDICEEMFDGDAADPLAQKELDFNNTLAFTDFSLVGSPYQYEFSNIDANLGRRIHEHVDYFTLRQYPAKSQPVHAMLTQNHELRIKGFMGATTAFRSSLIKEGVDVLAETQFEESSEARYIFGQFGKGSWAFYGGHDPEDYKHYVGEETIDLAEVPNSPGYRIIFNNIFFPATGIIDLSHSLTVFPNPVRNLLNIQMDTPMEGTLHISLFDNIGRLHMEKEARKTTEYWEHSIDIQHLPEGVYFLRIHQGRQQASLKVVKK